MKSSEKLLSKMKDQNLRPLPRWRFVLREAMIWSLLVLSVLIGALAFSIILFSIQQLEFDLVRHMSHSPLEFFLGLLPFLWIGFLVVFVIIGVVSLRRSRKGYKYSPSRLVFINLIISILLGTLLFIGGGAGWLEDIFASQVEVYESVNEKKVKLWSMPDEGYLSGTITQIGERSFELTDFQGKNWKVNYEKAFIPPGVLFEERSRIKIIGEKTSVNTFHAQEIRPWGQNRRWQK